MLLIPACNRTRMEILAPVGSPEALVAAIKGGCDAVYLAGKNFGARSFAKNFTDQELEGAVAYAHEHGVKVYVTVNTLVKNSEIEEAVSFVQFVKDVGADAVLIQDLGLLKATEKIPIAKHASTQMQVHSREGLEWCHRNGITRAVLARELNLDEIKEIVKDAPIEVEVFVQGAMCYSMSGGCLFSSIVGGRSGNRGECAQPCRKKYKHSDGKEGYLLSNADMYCIDYLKELEEIGVASVKIEGRMRSPAYAYLASKAYSTMLRDPGSPELESTISLLKTVFNRGYCTGYIGGAEELVQSQFPDNRGQFLGRMEINNRRFSTVGTDIGIKDGISFFQGDEKKGGLSIQNTGTCIIPFKIADGEYDVYRTYDPRIDTVKNLFKEVPRLTGSMKRCDKIVDMPSVKRAEKKCELSFYVSSVKMIPVVLPYADRIYYDGKDIEGAMKVVAADFKVDRPQCVLDAIGAYREGNDWLGAFIDDRCEVDKSYQAKSGDLYKEYRDYCNANGEYVRSTTDFYGALEQAGFKRKKTMSYNVIMGIAIKSDFLN